MGNDALQLRILILGGTGEARALATALIAAGHAVTSSLAGRTKSPILPPGDTRIGGFGGATGLAAYLTDHGFDLLIDATHPFAADISTNATTAAASTHVPFLRYERVPWPKPESAVWVELPDMALAANALPRGARVFLTVGRQELAPFLTRPDCRFLARMIEIPPGLPSAWEVLSDRGPFTLDNEMALLRTHAITHLVSKNSGGAQVAAKLEAAANLKIPVLMIARPPLPPARTVASVPETLDAIALIFRNGRHRLG